MPWHRWVCGAEPSADSRTEDGALYIGLAFARIREMVRSELASVESRLLDAVAEEEARLLGEHTQPMEPDADAGPDQAEDAN